MSTSKRTRNHDSYLDVTQFIMTEHKQFAIPSPHPSPLNPAQQLDKKSTQDCSLEYIYLTSQIFTIYSIIQIVTPNNLPLVIQVQGVELSPYFRLGEGQNMDIEFYDFTLQIPQEQEMSNEQYSIQEQNQFDHNNQNQEDESLAESHNEQIESSEIQPVISPSRLNIRSYNQIYRQLIKNKATDEQLKEFMCEYLTEEDLASIEIKDCPLETLEKTIVNNLRFVGPISWLQRKYKVHKYIEKKKKRIWKKKISYDCRKRVADNRLRVKGKFVTKQQACNMLGVGEEDLCENDIKELLEYKKTKSKPI